MPQFNVRLREEVIAEIRRRAKATGVTQAAVIETALSNGRSFEETWKRKREADVDGAREGSGAGSQVDEPARDPAVRRGSNALSGADSSSGAAVDVSPTIDTEAEAAEMARLVTRNKAHGMTTPLAVKEAKRELADRS